MKKILYIALAVLAFASCNTLEDDSYFKDLKTDNQNADVFSTEETCASYLQSHGEFSRISQLFQEQGIYQDMPSSGELHTILVVTDANYKAPVADSAAYVAKSHITNISVAPSKLNDGDRLLMWHNKYVTISMDESALRGNIIGHMQFNNATLMEVIKASDGYIYVISDMISTPTSLQDYINGLGEEYSTFKQMVLASGGREFDKANSKVVGIDSNGNTIYDTVWIYTNTFFDAKNFDLSSEALKATMLLFSNKVIEEALAEAMAKYEAWGYADKTVLMRNGSMDEVFVGYSSWEDIQKWILEVAFFNKTYTVEDLTPKKDVEDPSENDITSIYSRNWRTSVQQLDLAHPMNLSNGIAYNVVKFKIPNNRLIYRLHEEFNVYDKCDADQKAAYFRSENLTNFRVSTNEVEPWTPRSGYWPLHGDSPLHCKVADNSNSHLELDFTPLRSRPNADGGYDVMPLLVPPGTYRMAMGFKQGVGMNPFNIAVYAFDAAGDSVLCADPVGLNLNDGSTTYHYDRGASLSNRLPEYYNANDENNTAGSKNGYYWTDGGPVYTEITIPDLNEDGSALRLLFKMTYESANTQTADLVFNHWCLRPTVNNY